MNYSMNRRDDNQKRTAHSGRPSHLNLSGLVQFCHLFDVFRIELQRSTKNDLCAAVISFGDGELAKIACGEGLIQCAGDGSVQFVVIYLGIVMLAFFLAMLLSRSITNRISSVITRMRAVRQGPPVPMDSPTTHDEIGDLIDTYNYMTRKMNQLMEKQAKAAEDLRIAEFNSLQAQINPHFLYNTMDMINWMALQGRTDEITVAVQNLSRFYKLTLSKKNSISTIAREEEHVSIYVRLQILYSPSYGLSYSSTPGEGTEVGIRLPGKK